MKSVKFSFILLHVCFSCHKKFQFLSDILTLVTGNYKTATLYFGRHVVCLFFILQELNVRQLTLSTDKDKYGIRLRAEPDHMVLGKRLKGAFKAITASIKELASEQLENFQKTGTAV